MSTETPKKAPTGLGWEVKEFRNGDGTLKDCFVAAPRSEGMAYGLEVLGDDYTGYGDVEGKLKHCQMIVAWANASSPVSAEPTDDEIIDMAVEPLGIDCDRMPYGVVIFARAILSRYSAAPVAAQPDLTQQTLDDVMAGIPARDAEIEALRKEIEALQSQHAATLASIEAFVACDASAISYLSLGEYRTALLKMLRQAPATKEPGA